ncbi:MAG: recombination protein RecR [Candidatus Omnitrophica bacterium]|nr:recombination protein RecR [Candidatus Omnitrophota bacterium]
MINTVRPVEELIARLKQLPSIGYKTAERLAYFLLNASDEDAKGLAEAIIRVKDTVKTCSICYNIAEEETCAICRDATRQNDMICVVEEPKDIFAIEKTGKFHGRYHVLMGSVSPLDGIGPEDLTIDDLVGRIRQGGIQEVIIATDSDTEGESTAICIAQKLKPLPVTVTRLAYGLPVGSDIEYADPASLSLALEGRKEM